MVRAPVLLSAVFWFSLPLPAADRPEGTGLIDFFGYKDCVLLKNERTRVVLCPQAGGRVLEYSLDGKNAIALDPKAEGSRTNMTGGRFDIGPEFLIPRRPKLWTGEWTAEITGPRQARLVSQVEEAAGVRLIRTFELDQDTSRLRITQTIENVSDEIREWCHWSRTFAPTGGIVFIPLAKTSKLPRQYVMYEERGMMNYFPEDPHVIIQGDVLQITGITRRPKTGFDSDVGWLSYLMPNNMIFVKEFHVDRNAVYNELMGITIAIYYPDDYFVELEPIGPRMTLKPGERGDFTETWTLLEFPFPGAGKPAEADQVRSAVSRVLASPRD